MTALTDPSVQLARAFGRRVADWVRTTGAAAADVDSVTFAAEMLSLATSGGHVCLSLGALSAMADDATQAQAPPSVAEMDLPTFALSTPPSDAAPSRSIMQWRAVLLASGVVGHPAEEMAYPMILDQGDRLYLHRYFDYERRLAKRLSIALQQPRRTEGKAGRARLWQLLPVDSDALDRSNGQRRAVELALTRALTVISGGPGTGKTRLVADLLDCLLAQNPDERIALAAPTGKAATRLEQTLRASGLNTVVAAPQTLHRLLGVGSRTGTARHDVHRRLPLDTLIIDEASMLDLALATQVLEAMPDKARIVLLGDRDQLASVEAGSVFASLSAQSAHQRPVAAIDLSIDKGRTPMTQNHNANAAAALEGAVFWLTENFRFSADSGLGQLAGAIRSGQSAAALELLAHPQRSAGLGWIDPTSSATVQVQRVAMITGFADYAQLIGQSATTPALLLDQFERFRVLCALREGSCGVNACNEWISRSIRSEFPHRLDPGDSSPWYPGRPVLVLRNDYALGLFNGDSGICWPDEDQQLQVYFRHAEGLRAVAPALMPEHETAYALTVHKSQGSEFDRVLIILPLQAHPLVSRELLYTAVTRARDAGDLVASEAVINAALNHPGGRDSGLSARLDELAAESTQHPF